MTDFRKTAIEDEMIRVVGQRELFFLLHMMGSRGLAGYDDPFRGYLMDELEEAWEEQQQKLLEKGLLVRQGDKLEIELVTEALLAVLDSPYAMRLEIRKGGSSVYDGYIHMLPQMAVERLQDEQDPELLRISAIANLELALPILEKVFPADPEEETRGFGQPFIMPADIYDLIISAERGDELENLALTRPEIRRFMLLAELASDHGRLTLLERKGPLWRQQIVTFGLGPGGGWIAVQDEERNVKVENYRRRKLGQAMRSLVKDVAVKGNR